MILGDRSVALVFGTFAEAINNSLQNVYIYHLFSHICSPEKFMLPMSTYKHLDIFASVCVIYHYYVSITLYRTV